MSEAKDQRTFPSASRGVLLLRFLVGVSTFVIWGWLMSMLGLWLYQTYAGAVGWPARESGFVFWLGALPPTIVAMQGCRKPDWAIGVAAFLTASVVATVLIVNIVAATVVLRAIDPAMAGGAYGFPAAILAGGFLCAPTLFGAMALSGRWQAMGPRWRDLLRGKTSPYGSALGLVLGFAGMITALGLTLSFEDWLRVAYPGASDYSATGFGILCMVSVGLFMANARPTDRRSAARSVLGALAVFEVALAGAVTSMVVVVTLRSSLELALLIEFLLLFIPVYTGAIFLVVYRPGDKRDETADGDAGGEGPRA